MVARDAVGKLVALVVMGHGDEPGRSELAYLVRADSWRQGFGREAVTAVTNHLAPLLRVYGHSVDGAAFHIIDATARPDNPGSVGILHHTPLVEIGESEKHGAMRKHFSAEVGVPRPERAFTIESSWAGMVFSERF
jgi:hypothetical protein